MAPARGLLGRCDGCGGWLMANGVGYCANSRYRPYICAGNSAQTCLLCGRVKGGAKGCWGRGCLRNGGEPETLTEKQLRNRISNVRPRARERAQEEEAQKRERLAQERRAAAEAAEAKGLKSCFRQPGAPAAQPLPKVRWGTSGPQPVWLGRGGGGGEAAVRRKRYFEEWELSILWAQEAGSMVACDRCESVAPREEGGFRREEGQSHFSVTVWWCAACWKDARVGVLFVARQVAKKRNGQGSNEARTNERASSGLMLLL